MVKEVEKTPNFIRQLNKLDKSFLDRIEKLIKKIIENPETGKPMRYDRKGTREIYMKPFRISYAYNKEKDILYLLDIYYKDQQ
ncbi:MAG: type II toxin-antitoxin system RelE/ParE family toxin [Nanoarchaeota archaeon]